MQKEANVHCSALGRLTEQQARDAFEDKIDESLSAGDGWLHKWCKNETRPPPYHLLGSASHQLAERYVARASHGDDATEVGGVRGLQLRGTSATVFFKDQSART